MSSTDSGSAPADVVVIDAGELIVKQRGQDDAIARATAAFPGAHIFILADPKEIAVSGRAAAAPAIAVVSNDADAGDVVTAMRNAVSGAVLIYRPDVLALVRWLRRERATTTSQPSPLSRREREVLLMLSRGVHVSVIARTLELSVHTVRSHVKKILVKLRCHSQLEAVAKAMHEGWISIDG